MTPDLPTLVGALVYLYVGGFGLGIVVQLIKPGRG